MLVRALPYVDPRAPRGRLHPAFVKLASARSVRWLSRTAVWRNTVWRLDPHLLRLTGGRISTGLLLPTALLETRGARTGRPRRNAVIYFHDGDRVTVIASQAGRPENPSWFYNACSNPDVLLGGQPFRVEGRRRRGGPQPGSGSSPTAPPGVRGLSRERSALRSHDPHPPTRPSLADHCLASSREPG